MTHMEEFILRKVRDMGLAELASCNQHNENLGDEPIVDSLCPDCQEGAIIAFFTYTHLKLRVRSKVRFQFIERWLLKPDPNRWRTPDKSS